MADELVDVDGCRLSVRTAGSGTPTVVMLSSAGGAHEQWERLLPLLTTAQLTYGRPGLGGSDPAPMARAEPEDHDWATRQLHELLRAVDLPPPYLLVTCSVGAYLADRFARLWPQEVAGLVQLDPTPITPLPRMGGTELIDDAGGRGLLLSRAQCLQLLTTEPPTFLDRSVVVSRAHGTLPQEALERYWRPLTMAEADEAWRERQHEWARRMRAVHVIADTAGHFVHEDQPELVAAIVEAVIAAWRRGEPLHLERKGIAAIGGRLVESS